MAIKVGDREFTHPGLANKYRQSLEDEKRVQSQADRSRQDVEGAPGGEEHIGAIRDHGVVRESSIKFEGNGRWRHTAVHADGSKSTSVHPQWHRAQEVQSKYFDPDGKPPALETHQRSRAHPTGPKESERLAKEDGREPEDDE